MSGLEYAWGFKDLVVYQKARAAAKQVFECTKSFPREEMYSLTDQVRRSVRSIGAQIAEAWSKRRYEKHFISKLTDADAELAETQHWIDTAHDSGYLAAEQVARLGNQLQEVGRMLNSMIGKAASFCQPHHPVVRDPVAEYFCSEPGSEEVNQ